MSAHETEHIVAIVMSDEAARALSEACQIGKFRVEDWLDNQTGATRARQQQAEQAREWLDWGQRWLIDGRRIEVPGV